MEVTSFMHAWHHLCMCDLIHDVIKGTWPQWYYFWHKINGISHNSSVYWNFLNILISKLVTWIRDISLLILCHGGKYNNKSQAICSHLQEGCKMSQRLQCILLRSKNSPIQDCYRNPAQTSSWVNGCQDRSMQTTKMRK